MSDERLSMPPLSCAERRHTACTCFNRCNLSLGFRKPRATANKLISSTISRHLAHALVYICVRENPKGVTFARGFVSVCVFGAQGKHFAHFGEDRSFSKLFWKPPLLLFSSLRSESRRRKAARRPWKGERECVCDRGRTSRYESSYKTSITC